MARDPWQYIKPATLDDAVFLAPRLRAADAAEIWAESHTLPLDALVLSLANSSVAFTVHYGEPTAMFGLVPGSFLSGSARVWALGSDNNRGHRIKFLRHSRFIVDLLRQGYECLYNYVDARHKETLAWLRWLKADILPAAPYGVDGLPFHRFEWRQAPCVPA